MQKKRTKTCVFAIFVVPLCGFLCAARITHMIIYFLFIRIAALFGHKKAGLIVKGQRSTFRQVLHKDANTQHLKGAIWVHVSSVGEFEQSRPLIERLRREQPARKVVLTFFSPSGYELRKDYDKVDQVLYLPFATRRNAKAWLAAIEPSMAIFVKYEFWPAYLHALKKANIPTYSISSIFRPQQLFFKPWGKPYLNLLKCFTQIFVQDGDSHALLLKHGIANSVVTGDTRFDRVVEIQQAHKDILVVQRFIEGSDKVIIACSTWPKDEQLLARYMQTLENRLDSTERIKLIIAPHEIDEKHMHFLFQLFKGRYVRYTQANHISMQHMDVLIIDTIGLLSSIYQYGTTAYIGGGFGAGIHNALEAAVYGIPVVWGPNYKRFREAKGLIQSGAAQSITNYKELELALDYALANHTEIGIKSAQYVQNELGATDKLYNRLFKN